MKNGCEVSSEGMFGGVTEGDGEACTSDSGEGAVCVRIRIGEMEQEREERRWWLRLGEERPPNAPKL